MQQTAAMGVKVWSTPWSPPREWKTNHDNNNGGTLDPAHYQDYANLLGDYFFDQQRRGVSLYAISLQNEPNWEPDYESCRLSVRRLLPGASPPSSCCPKASTGISPSPAR
jgi:O-glycosyl hydrolase